MKNFNDNHPELKEGEVFLCNLVVVIDEPRLNISNLPGDDLIPASIEMQFHELSYKTKRLGMKAYNNNGKPLEVSLPVFVQKEELEKGKRC